MIIVFCLVNSLIVVFNACDAYGMPPKYVMEINKCPLYKLGHNQHRNEATSSVMCGHTSLRGQNI